MASTSHFLDMGALLVLRSPEDVNVMFLISGFRHYTASTIFKWGELYSSFNEQIVTYSYFLEGLELTPQV